MLEEKGVGELMVATGFRLLRVRRLDPSEGMDSWLLQLHAMPSWGDGRVNQDHD